MSEQDGAQSSLKQRKGRITNTANQENAKQAPAAQRPPNDDTEAWKTYWEKQVQPWRTEPEIDEERQKYLAERRSIKPNIKQGMYPFKDIKLNRADVEWLLTTHESSGMSGAVDWSDKSQREREGLDLRGANLCQENLSGLPLAKMSGGLTEEEWSEATEEQRNMAAVHFQEAILREAQLQGAILREAQLQGAILRRAQLQGAILRRAQLQGAILWGAQLQKANLRRAQLQGVDLRRVDFDSATLDGVTLSDETYGSVYLADVRWGDVNLAVIDWSHVISLGDEEWAYQIKDNEGKTKDKQTRIDEYKEAVRANRQLAVVLRDQGMNEEADYFAYRAQKLQRVVWRLQRKPLKFVLSWFLYLLAGYGYRPVRSIIWYLVIIIGFAAFYFAFGHISPLEAFVLSLTSFHGRGFFPGTNLNLSDPRVVLAAFEAVVGLLIEISFIATFTQRFFGK